MRIFTITRMPAKVVSEIKGAKIARNSQAPVTIWQSVCYLQNTVRDTPKHYVWHPQTVCLTISNMLFDNFNTSLSPSKPPLPVLSIWPSNDYDNLQNTAIFCPSDFGNDFRGHSRDSKRARNWLVFSLVRTYYEGKVIVSVPVNVSLPVIVNVVVPVFIYIC